MAVSAAAQTVEDDRSPIGHFARGCGFHGDVSIGRPLASCFRKSNYYLVTNRHVVLSCAEDTNPDDVGGWICADKLKYCTTLPVISATGSGRACTTEKESTLDIQT